MARIDRFEDLEVRQTAVELEVNKLGAFMHYLRNSEIKGQKFKKN